ncbi:hypothetical protein CP533_4741 [Ophiocordyceps camponoti-saundersi (nom. inval.)]|nr:hypothetical protein CP533_4741 [Ophiocordyceps camponoti-saundersi (nom. inval.)]
MDNPPQSYRRLHQTSHRIFQYTCASSGIICILLYFMAMVAADFIPPMPPSWDAEQTVSHYRNHEKGIQAGAALMIIAGMFYLPFTVTISAQMRRIPNHNLNYTVSSLQLASGAAVIFTLVMPGIFLATANYRLDRPVEITQALNDLFWFMIPLPWPIVMAQNLAFAYAIMTDSRPKPLFPKAIGFLNIIVPVVYIPSIAVHCFKTGPLAWNGGVSFWLINIAAGVQMIVDSICLMLVVSSAPAEDVGNEIDAVPSEECGK